MNQKKEVIIVGGGFAGISAAKVLRNTEWNVTIIDKKNHHLFQPLLYQVATAALSPGDIAMPIRAIFSKDRNIRTILGEVIKINVNENSLILKTGEEKFFDYLILAPGAEYHYFGNNDWANYAPGLKTIDNALDIREQILISLEKADQIQNRDARKPFLRYVIIGAGPTGVETAGAISEIAKRNMMRDFKNINPEDTEIFLIEAGQRVLNGYTPDLSQRAKEDLEKMGIKVLLNTKVTGINKDGVQTDSQFFETPNIVWAAGVTASPLIGALGMETDKTGRLKVNPNLTVKGSDSIFVIGDAAYIEDEQGNPVPALAPAALQMGRYVGKMIKNGADVRNSVPFRYTDKGTMATIGRAKAVADIRGLKFRGFFAWLLWSVIHIFFLIGFRNRFRVFAEWVWHYITFKRGVRLITGRKSVYKFDMSFSHYFKNSTDNRLLEWDLWYMVRGVWYEDFGMRCGEFHEASSLSSVHFSLRGNRYRSEQPDMFVGTSAPLQLFTPTRLSGLSLSLRLITKKYLMQIKLQKRCRTRRIHLH